MHLKTLLKIAVPILSILLLTSIYLGSAATQGGAIPYWDFPIVETIYFPEAWPWATQLTMAKECKIDTFTGMISTTVWDQLQPLGWTFTSSITGWHMCYVGFNCRPEAPPPGGAYNYHGRTPGFKTYPVDISSFRLALQYIIGCEKTTWLWEIFKYINVRNDICVPPSNVYYRNPYIPLYDENWDMAEDILIENGFRWELGADGLEHTTDDIWYMPNGKRLSGGKDSTAPGSERWAGDGYGIYIMSPTAPTTIEMTARHVKKWNKFFIGEELDPRTAPYPVQALFKHDANTASSTILKVAKYNRDHDLYVLCWGLGRNPDYLYDFFHPDVDVYGGDNTPGLNHPGLNRLLETIKFWKVKDYEIIDANYGDEDEKLIAASTEYKPIAQPLDVLHVKIQRCHKTGVYYEYLTKDEDYTLVGEVLHILKDIILYPGDALEINYKTCTYARLITDTAELQKIAWLIQWKLYYLCPYCPIYSRDYIDLFKPGITCWVESKGYGAHAYQLPWSYATMHWVGDETGLIPIKHDVPGDVVTLNPITASWVYEVQILNRIYDFGTTVNPLTHVDMPWVVCQWATKTWTGAPSGLGMIIKFWLRDDVTWQDGDPFTAQDAKWCLDYICTNRTDIGTPFPEFYPIWTTMVKCEVVNDYLIEIWLDATGWWKVLEFAGSLQTFPQKVWEPLTTYTAATAFSPWAVRYDTWTGLPAPLYSDVNGDGIGDLTCLYGTGPYWLESWNEADLAVCHRYPDYWVRKAAAPSGQVGQLTVLGQCSKVLGTGEIIPKMTRSKDIEVTFINVQKLVDCTFEWSMKVDGITVVNKTVTSLAPYGVYRDKPTWNWKDPRFAPCVHTLELWYQKDYGGGLKGPWIKTYTLKIALTVGDKNCDCKVDMKDIVMNILLFGLKEGMPGYDDVADVETDGKLDMKDLVIDILYFGKKCEC